MITKVIEIRDRATCIPAVAIRMQAANEGQGYLLRRCGFPPDGHGLVMMKLENQRATSDMYEWGGRTMQVAHRYIEEHFDALHDGDVIDVEFILGEVATAKMSERYLDKTTGA